MSKSAGKASVARPACADDGRGIVSFRERGDDRLRPTWRPGSRSDDWRLPEREVIASDCSVSPGASSPPRCASRARRGQQTPLNGPQSRKRALSCGARASCEILVRPAHRPSPRQVPKGVLETTSDRLSKRPPTDVDAKCAKKRLSRPSAWGSRSGSQSRGSSSCNAPHLPEGFRAAPRGHGRTSAHDAASRTSSAGSVLSRHGSKWRQRRSGLAARGNYRLTTYGLGTNRSFSRSSASRRRSAGANPKRPKGEAKAIDATNLSVRLGPP